MRLTRILLATVATWLAFCAVGQAWAEDAVLSQVVAGDWRKQEDRARDAARHPIESLTFWGMRPGVTVLEVQPGGGWWTDILAPYAHRTGGKLFVTGADLDNPKLSDRARQSRANMEAKFAAAPQVYGKVGVVNWGSQSAPLKPDQYDFVLVARAIHGWMRTEGGLDSSLREFYTSLKPGGILAIEQHRANPGPQDPQAASGYVTEAHVIEQVEKAGFKLVARSEINANPKDTKDHPFGVWTLPPTRITVPYSSGKEPDPNFDHSKYDAIGESDRMTLKFVKP
jgi:predicted methyltransferase